MPAAALFFKYFWVLEHDGFGIRSSEYDCHCVFHRCQIAKWSQDAGTRIYDLHPSIHPGPWNSGIERENWIDSVLISRLRPGAVEQSMMLRSETEEYVCYYSKTAHFYTFRRKGIRGSVGIPCKDMFSCSISTVLSLRRTYDENAWVLSQYYWCACFEPRSLRSSVVLNEIVFATLLIFGTLISFLQSCA